MTDVAKLASELRVGDIVIHDVLPPRIIQRLRPSGQVIVVNSIGTEAGGEAGGEYEETFARDHLVTIQTL